MSEYVNTLIVTMLVSQLAIMLAPSKGDAKKYVKLVCALVLIMCLYSPLIKIIKNGGEFVDKIKNMLTVSSENSSISNKYGDAATVLTEYVTEKYSVQRDNIRITFITDEADVELLEIHVFLNNTGAATADRLEQDLMSQLSVPIYVFVGAE